MPKRTSVSSRAEQPSRAQPSAAVIATEDDAASPSPFEWLLPRGGSALASDVPWIACAALLEIWERRQQVASPTSSDGDDALPDTPPEVAGALHALLSACASCHRGRAQPALVARGGHVWRTDAAVQCVRCTASKFPVIAGTSAYTEAARGDSRVVEEVPADGVEAAARGVHAASLWPCVPSAGRLDTLVRSAPLRELLLGHESLLAPLVSGRWGALPGLVTLALDGAGLTSSHIALLSRWPGFRTLRRLSVAHNPRLRTLQPLASKLASLRELDVSGTAVFDAPWDALLGERGSWLRDLARAAGGTLELLVALHVFRIGWYTDGIKARQIAQLLPALKTMVFGPKYGDDGEDFEVRGSSDDDDDDRFPAPRRENPRSGWRVVMWAPGRIIPGGGIAQSFADTEVALEMPWLLPMSAAARCGELLEHLSFTAKGCGVPHGTSEREFFPCDRVAFARFSFETRFVAESPAPAWLFATWQRILADFFATSNRVERRACRFCAHRRQSPAARFCATCPTCRGDDRPWHDGGDSPVERLVKAAYETDLYDAVPRSVVVAMRRANDPNGSDEDDSDSSMW